MQDLHAVLLQPRRDGLDGLVQAPGALRAAGHQQGGQPLVEAEVLPGLGPGRVAVQGGDGAAERDPDVPGVAQLAVGGGDRDEVAVPRADLVGQARTGVRLVHHDRHPGALGGQVGGHRHVAAEADHGVRLDPLDDLLGGPYGAAQADSTVISSGVGLRGSGTAGISSRW